LTAAVNDSSRDPDKDLHSTLALPRVTECYVSAAYVAAADTKRHWLEKGSQVAPKRALLSQANRDTTWSLPAGLTRRVPRAQKILDSDIWSRPGTFGSTSSVSRSRNGSIRGTAASLSSTWPNPGFKACA